MHPLDYILREYGITRYKIAKETEFTEAALSQIIRRDTAVSDLKLGLIVEISKISKVPINIIINKLYKNEEIINMEKELRKELIGNEYTLVELDNEMMEFGFKSAMNEISTDVIKSGSIAWYPKKDDNDRFMNVFIDVIRPDKENPLLKIDDVIYEF